MAKNFYTILGLTPQATKEQIIRAYRLLAVKYHPDKKGGDNKKFSAIKEAYENLKKEWNKPIESPLSGEILLNKENLKIVIHVPLRDIACKKTRIIHYNRKIPCQTCLSHVCKKCGGSGNDPIAMVMKKPRPCITCNGDGYLFKECLDCGGKGYHLKEDSVRLDLHPLMGGTVVFKGKGNECKAGRGHLVVDIYIDKDFTYHLSGGLNLKRSIIISPSQAAVGDTINLDVFGKKVPLTIPAGIQNNRTIKKASEGLSYKGHHGDLFVMVSIGIPESVSVKEKNLYTKLLKIEKEKICPNQ